MTDPNRFRRDYSIAAAVFSVMLALLFASLVAWAGHYVVIDCLRQEELTFWVALSIAVLIWFIEEMLQLTLPCRRALRRLAHRLAELWISHRGGQGLG